MPTDPDDGRLARRIADLYAYDAQFAAARPDDTTTAAISQPDMRLAQIVQTVMKAYADRPALGARAVELVTDPETGRASHRLLPRFDTITYRELWQRATELARTLVDELVVPGDRVCVLGFTSIDYTTVDLALVASGAVAVPMQTGARLGQLQPIVAETEPVLIASSIDNLTDAVELALTGHQVKRLLVFDYQPAVDDQRDAFAAAGARLAKMGSSVVVETLADARRRGQRLPTATLFPTGEEDPLRLLIYTSGSTGTPKGAMHTERLVAGGWRPSAWFDVDRSAGEPIITLNFMPMSHVMGRSVLHGTLGKGGTAYFSARSDLSTLLEDLALVRPTRLNFVPRIWEMLYQTVGSEVDRRLSDGADRAVLERHVMAEMRQGLLGGRFVEAMTGSAPTSPGLKSWVETFLDMHLVEGYGSTEAGMAFIDGTIRRPPVVDYKLADVPELGYYMSDRPHPRGELLLKSQTMFPGYYHRPELTADIFDAEGYYRTGDIVAELGPDQVAYLDRRNYVLKLSQGEFVAVSKLEAVFATSPLVRQIYVYGNSARSYVLAVVVPTADALSQHDITELKPLIVESLRTAAQEAGLQSYEIPRDLIVDAVPFTLENGLLTGIRKLARPKLKEHYGAVLEQLYVELADAQAHELRALRRDGSTQPVLQTVVRAAGATLGTRARELAPDAHFTDLGGDSLSALTFSQLLQEIFGFDVPVSVIVSPTTDLHALADYIEAARRPGAKRATFASVHGDGATVIQSTDLRLEKFVETEKLSVARSLELPGAHVRTVLLTGATGFLGRFLALEWLERLSLVGGKLICLVRANDQAEARARLNRVFDSGDAGLLGHYRDLAADHLEVVAGDKSEADLGLDQPTWQRLADTVDLIVDCAALVNHVLPYRQLFGPNVTGTAELIRLALSTKLKPITYLSTVGVGDQISPSAFVENADIRTISPTRTIDDSYANGYSNSKWAGEVLLREAHDRCGLPVAVFRCDLIMVDTRYRGQLNVPDMFTRLILSVAATGIAPESFYQLDAAGHRQRAHYDGLPVDFIAEAIATLGTRVTSGFETHHVMNPYDDGIGLDTFVDWLVEAGYPIRRVTDYDRWLQRFEAAMRALPDRQRQNSVLPLLHSYRQPLVPPRGAHAPVQLFRAAVQDAKIGPDKDIPHITRDQIVKYATNLELLGLL